MKALPKFATEAALCASFLAWLKGEAGRYSRGEKTPEWTPYAETAGWDILLVGADGTQIGIQAKLRFNLKVLQQSIPNAWDVWHDRGPDYRAVLVPDWDSDVATIAAALGLTLLGRDARGWNSPPFVPGLLMNEGNGGWHFWSPRERCSLPDFVPDVPAGASAPVQLTKWKIAALRIVARLALRGFVTKQDFGEIGIDPRRWMGPKGWLVSGETRARWLRGPSLDFDKQHPVVYAQIFAEEKAILGERAQPIEPVQGVLA